MNKVTKIVLTGGPCAGKTTALARIKRHFTAKGLQVMTVPEVPTMVTESGWNYLSDNRDFYREGERVIIETQIALEDCVMRMARTLTNDCLVICDRGALDVKAYEENEIWEELFQDCQLTEDQLLANYDAVVHLVSAAKGAEMFYQTANNSNRYEQADENGRKLARQFDDLIAKAWSKHPHVRTILAEESFEDKMYKMLGVISELIAINS